MPFQSEKQRRYLWANEPEIARDWADTYGSRIESNTGGITRLGFANSNKEYLDFKKWFDAQQKQGQEESVHDLYERYERDKRDKKVYDQKHMAATGGIMRLGYANGPITDDMGNTFADTQYKDLTLNQFNERFGGMDYQVTEEKEETGDEPNFLEKLMNLSPVRAAMGAFKGPELTQAQKQMNQAYMTNYNVDRDPITGRMVGGPFHGMNAPGTSAFGSATSQDMAQKWLEKYGAVDHYSDAMKQKKQTMIDLVGSGQQDVSAPNYPGNNQGSGGNMGSANTGAYSSAGKTGAKEGYAYGLNRGGVAGLWPR